MNVIPEGQYKEKQWQVVVRSFEIRQYWEGDNDEEKFVYVLYHLFEAAFELIDFKYFEEFDY